jgi:hypothetical protein
MKREKKIIRKSLNNDDEIELSFRFNENWIKFNSLSAWKKAEYGKFKIPKKWLCVPWITNEENVCYATDVVDQRCV